MKLYAFDGKNKRHGMIIISLLHSCPDLAVMTELAKIIRILGIRLFHSDLRYVTLLYELTCSFAWTFNNKGKKELRIGQ